jgi:hypothetical protein
MLNFIYYRRNKSPHTSIRLPEASTMPAFSPSSEVTDSCPSGKQSGLLGCTRRGSDENNQTADGTFVDSRFFTELANHYRILVS